MTAIKEKLKSCNATQYDQASPTPTCLLATCTLDSDPACDVQIQTCPMLKLHEMTKLVLDAGPVA